jgi:hypothetical protein
MTANNEGSSISFCSQKVSHQYLTWGTNLRSAKLIFSLFEKLWTEKYPYIRLTTCLQHLRLFDLQIQEYISLFVP